MTAKLSGRELGANARDAQRVLEIAEEVLGRSLSPSELTADLDGIGLDSFAATELLIALSEKLPGVVQDDFERDFAAAQSLEEIRAAFTLARMNGQ